MYPSKIHTEIASSSSIDDSRYYSLYTDPQASSKLSRQMFHASHSTSRLEQDVNELYYMPVYRTQPNRRRTTHRA
ncbi:hypothetical protein LguiB_020084 [Lonicera macranthoides]